MLTQTAEHALRALLFLARHEQGTNQPSHEIAEAIGAPPRYLATTLRALVEAGMIESTRGPGGGVRLALPADRIAIVDVMRVFDESPRTRICLTTASRCEEQQPCASHRLWCRLKEQAHVPFQQTTLETLLRGATHDDEVEP